MKRRLSIILVMLICMAVYTAPAYAKEHIESHMYLAKGGSNSPTIKKYERELTTIRQKLVAVYPATDTTDNYTRIKTDASYSGKTVMSARVLYEGTGYSSSKPLYIPPLYSAVSFRFYGNNPDLAAYCHVITDY